ncbi:bifunctional 5,10-methylene-tetrahydrofolate dehydrogenase/5,10-methylene-tetrahydrofolate cyclohydrolase, partial [Candidatus Woesebacteria bacterium]|nr:bifunctional 5,10-methylene-tetrahydrofolate dehydrogenase/5,10-methylene-tetrahydrofolate cyclohydrolase [Candidatus Woesebacteria bacterium]
MKIPCDEISQFLKETLQSNVLELEKGGVTPKLVTILVGSSPEQLSFVNIKKRIATEIGVSFELVHLDTPPPLDEFQALVREKAEDTKTSG